MLDRLLAFVRAFLAPVAPLPPARWAVLNLMGHQVVHGLVRAPVGGIVHVRRLLPDGRLLDDWYTQHACYGVEHMDELEVRLAYLLSQATAGSVCGSYDGTPVLAGVCRRCLCSPEGHVVAARLRDRPGPGGGRQEVTAEQWEAARAKGAEAAPREAQADEALDSGGPPSRTGRP